MINAMHLTDHRKARFAKDLLRDLARPIGVVDVGSGGALKSPWSLLPPAVVEKVEFDAEAIAGPNPPLAISNKTGEADFYVARVPRASSLHLSNPAFVKRFGVRPSMFPTVLLGWHGARESRARSLAKTSSKPRQCTLCSTCSGVPSRC